MVLEFTPEFIEDLRSLNVVLGACALLVMIFGLGIPRWKSWNLATRLGWMALLFMCLSGTYGTFEIKYLDTYYRVPMVTLSMMWILMAGAVVFVDNRSSLRSRRE